MTDAPERPSPGSQTGDVAGAARAGGAERPAVVLPPLEPDLPLVAVPVGEHGEQPAALQTSDESEALAGPNAELLALVDRLTDLLERSDLIELEVEAGGTGLILRKPDALGPALAPAASGSSADSLPDAGTRGQHDAGTSGHGASREAGPAGQGQAASATGPSQPLTKSVRAPLTGIYYNAPSPGSPPYVTAGGEVAVGQIIGLIEAMKLFNEIKSDQAGRVVRVVAETGSLVKAKQPLIEVEPL